MVVRVPECCNYTYYTRIYVRTDILGGASVAPESLDGRMIIRLEYPVDMGHERVSRQKTNLSTYFILLSH